MTWLYKIQQRISITAKETVALITVMGLFVLGGAVRYIQQHTLPVATQQAQYTPSSERHTPSYVQVSTHSAIMPDSTALQSAVPTSDSVHTAQPAIPSPDSLATSEPVVETAPVTLSPKALQEALKDANKVEKKPRSAKKELPVGKVNINTASLAQLSQLPGVGPATAERIMAFRQVNGRFARPDAIQEVKGIGPKKYEKMAAFITV